MEPSPEPPIDMKTVKALLNGLVILFLPLLAEVEVGLTDITDDTDNAPTKLR